MTRTVRTVMTRDTRQKLITAVDVRATGNFPFVRAAWILKYRTTPIIRTHIPNVTVVAPSGRAKDLILAARWDPLAAEDMVNSWTRATPVDAIARLVRT